MSRAKSSSDIPSTSSSRSTSIHSNTLSSAKSQSHLPAVAEGKTSQHHHYVPPKPPAPLAIPHRKIEPTDFKLPGEAFAERQRLKKEQKLKELEEQERSAREFKANKVKNPPFYYYHRKDDQRDTHILIF